MSIQITYPNEKLLEEMRIEEDKIRQSKEYIDKCDKVSDVPNGWLTVTDEMQHELCRSFGFVDQISNDYACERLRTAHILFPNNEVFKQSLYVKNNKANEGTLKQGDSVPNVEIYGLNKTKTDLVNIITDTDLSESKPTIIFAGSHT